MGLADDPQVQAIIALALSEDVGTGDVTSLSTIPADHTTHAEVVVKQHGVIAGLDVLGAVFAQVDPALRVTLLANDGDSVAEPPQVVATIDGPTRGVLAGERTALNVFGHMCGIATAVRDYMDRIAGTDATILDTRKTLPGLRALDKYAVTCGGGTNHRTGLYDAILIKDNHLRAAGGVQSAIEAARATYPDLPLTVEVETDEQLRQAIDCGAQRIMLDNMAPARMRDAVSFIDGRAEVEASGGVTLDSVRTIADTGVDAISVGAITHSAKWLDVSLEVQ